MKIALVDVGRYRLIPMLHWNACQRKARILWSQAMLLGDAIGLRLWAQN